MPARSEKQCAAETCGVLPCPCFAWIFEIVDRSWLRRRAPCLTEPQRIIVERERRGPEIGDSFDRTGACR
jgi:hypothetical protein